MHIYVNICRCRHTAIYIHTHSCIYIYTQVCRYRTRICIRRHMSTHMGIYTCICMHMNISLPVYRRYIICVREFNVVVSIVKESRGLLWYRAHRWTRSMLFLICSGTQESTPAYVRQRPTRVHWMISGSGRELRSTSGLLRTSLMMQRAQEHLSRLDNTSLTCDRISGPRVSCNGK